MRRPAARGSSPSLPGAAGRALSAPSVITERKILHAAPRGCRAAARPLLVEPRDDADELVEADDRAEDYPCDHHPARAELAVEQPPQAHQREHREEDGEPRGVGDGAAA